MFHNKQATYMIASVLKWLCLKSGPARPPGLKSCPAKKTRPGRPGPILDWEARPGRILGNKQTIQHDFQLLIVNAYENYGVDN